MERPDLFGKSSLGAKIATTASDAALIQETIRAAHLDRLYAPLFRNSSPPPTSAKPTDGAINQ